MKAKRLSYVLPLVLSSFAVAGCNPGVTTTDTTEPTPTHEHNYEYVEKVDATCTATGMEAHYTCDGCDKIFDAEKAETTAESLTIGKIAHTTVKQNGQAATCDVDGWKDYYKCSVCNGYFSDEAGTSVISNLDAWKAGAGKVAKKGHTIGKVNGQAATCTVDGWKDYYECSVCSALFEDQAGAKPINDLGAWKAGDGKVAAHHTLEKQNGQAATCIAEGWKDYYECSVVGCGALFEDEAATKPIEDLDAWKLDLNGGKLDKVPHQTEKVDGLDATCTSVGYEDAYQCKKCDAYFEDEAATKPIADYDAWKSDLDGGKIDMLAHNVKKVNGLAATCTEDGYEEAYQCEDCDAYFEDEAATTLIADYDAWKSGSGKIEKTGHDFATAWTTDGTNHWHACQNAGCTAKDGEAAHDMQAQSSSENFKYDAKTTWEECSECGYKANEVTDEAPWKSVPFTSYKALASEHGNNKGYEGYSNPELEIVDNVAQVKGFYNNGIEATVRGEDTGRHILSVTLQPSKCSWGVNFYMRLYKNTYEEKNQIFPTSQVYSGTLSKIFDAGGKIYNESGNEVSSIDANHFFTFEYDFSSKMAEGDKIVAFTCWLGWDTDDAANSYANAQYIRVKDVTFKSTLCGHPVSDYEQKSVQKTSEFDAATTWDECKTCGQKMNIKDTCPVGKTVINLSNYATNTGITQISGNSITSDQDGGNTSSTVMYNIPTRFIGKGKLVVTLKLNAVWAGFDIRVGKSDGTNLVHDFGQVMKEDNVEIPETPLNRGYSCVTAVNLDTGATTFKSSATPTNQKVHYEFDLSNETLTAANVVKFALWYGHQNLEISEFYFMDNCDHEGATTTEVVTEVGQNVDGTTTVYCNKCGQCISSVVDQYTERMDVNLPESIELANNPGAEKNFPNILEHETPRTKFVLKWRYEVKNGENWEYPAEANYATYVGFLASGTTKLATGLYYSNAATQEDKIQVHSGNGGDARTLFTEPNQTEGGTYGVLPTLITKEYDSSTHVITWTFDLTDAVGAQLCGLSFRNSTANSRVHILEAYQMIPVEA